MANIVELEHSAREVYWPHIPEPTDSPSVLDVVKEKKSFLPQVPLKVRRQRFIGKIPTIAARLIRLSRVDEIQAAYNLIDYRARFGFTDAMFMSVAIDTGLIIHVTTYASGKITYKAEIQ